MSAAQVEAGSKGLDNLGIDPKESDPPVLEGTGTIPSISIVFKNTLIKHELGAGLRDHLGCRASAERTPEATN